MPRTYIVPFENVTISAVQDLVALKGSTGKTCKVNRVWIGATNTTIQTAQGLRLRVKFGSATVTLGSGGTVPTPTPLDPGDTAAAFTAHANDTTQATTSGAFTGLPAQGVHNYGGWDFSFKNPPIFGLNQAVIFELLSTVSGTCAFSGGAEVEESGL
jgi:hypothetical protein